MIAWTSLRVETAKAVALEQQLLETVCHRLGYDLDELER